MQRKIELSRSYIMTPYPILHRSISVFESHPQEGRGRGEITAKKTTVLLRSKGQMTGVTVTGDSSTEGVCDARS